MAKRTVIFPASQEQTLVRKGWFGDYEETLVHKRGAVDLSFLNSGNARILLDHDPRRACGNIKRAWLDDGRMFVEACFTDEIEEGANVIARMDSDPPLYSNVSVGWDYRDKDLEMIRSWDSEGDDNKTRKHKEKMREEKIDFAVTFKKWQPREVSIVAMPADDKVGMGRNSTPYCEATRTQHLYNLWRQQTMNPEQQQQTPQAPVQERNDSPQVPPVQEPTQERQQTQTPPAPPVQEPTQERQQTQNTPPVTRAGYNVLRAQEARLQSLGISAEKVRELQDQAANEGWTSERANGAIVSLLEDNNPEVSGVEGAGQINIGRGNRNYSLANAIREAVAGRLHTGQGSLEAEMHLDASRQGGRTTPSNTFALPMRLLMQDKVFMRMISEGQRQRLAAAGQRALDTSGNAGMLVDDFDEMHLIEALYPRAGLFGRVRVMPQVLNQDLKVPIESGTHASGWVGEDDTRADTTTPTYANNLTWSWHEVYSQFAITRQLIDQTAYLYSRIMNLLNRDIPRNINDALINGSGSGNTPAGIRNISGVASKSSGTNGGALTLSLLNAMITDVENANADYLGSAIWLCNSKTIGKLRETEQFSGAGGLLARTLVQQEGANLSMLGTPVVRDNFLPSNLVKGTGTGLSAMAYVIPSEIVLAYFSDLSLIVDPYSAKKNGKIEVQIRQALDWQMEHTASCILREDVVTV